MKLKKRHLSVNTQAREDFPENRLAKDQKVNILPTSCSYDYRDGM